MNNFKIKILITLLGSLIFALLFVLLALVIPTEKNKEPELMNTKKQVTTAAELANELKKH